MKSIRTFLVVVIVAVVCLINFTAALHGYQSGLESVDRIEEQQLLDKARTLAALVEHESDIPADLFGSKTLFQVWHQQALLAVSQNAPDTMLCGSDNQFHLKSYAGIQWLIYCFRPVETDVSVLVGTEHHAYSSLTEDVLIRTILPIIWILPLIGLLVGIVVKIGTKPLKRLAEVLSEKKANDFSLIALDRCSGELIPILNALNGLFIRLAAAFERERRFSANAAHELRTPLSAMNISLHNLAQNHYSQEMWDTLKRATNRMEHSIEQLLSLHRVSLDVDGGETKQCDVFAISQAVIAEVYDDFAEKSQSIELEGHSAFISANPSSLDILVRNLLDNASKYTPNGGVVQVKIWQEGGRSYFLIEDSGPGIAENEYSRVLGRFYRVGGDRNDSKIVGSGLGLSIVDDIVRMHEGTIQLSKSRKLGGLSVEVSFPAAGGGVK